MQIRQIILFAVIVMMCLPGCVSEQSHYVRYLHKYMSEEDERTYKPEFWEENVAKALEIRDRTDRDYPKKYFKHFVLPVRVAGEPLDRFRMVYADTLCNLVKGMNPERAALAINTWCRKQATYMDGWKKTQSAMGTVEYGYGLCSDLTVLVINALRAAGFPAREVVTTWADYRSNHAWVEVYVNGRWAMMGSAEPFPQLDMNAWKNHRRVMCAEIDVIGDYHGPETVLSRNGKMTRISNLSGYVPVKKAEVSVYDSLGRPARGASVQFLMYHEGGLHTLVSATTGIRGGTVVELGMGDVVAFAYKDGLFGMAKVSGSQDEAGLILRHSITGNSAAEFELSPPQKNPEWGHVEPDIESWTQLDSVRKTRLEAHPADEARVQSFIDEPRRGHLPEVSWPVMGRTRLDVNTNDSIAWGRELSIYKVEDGSLVDVSYPYVPSGRYIAVTGTERLENYTYKVRIETFSIPDGLPEFNVPVSMPSL